MTLYDYAGQEVIETAAFPQSRRESAALFIVCRKNEVPALRGVFGFDESTVLERTALDESVRFGAYDGYDFISMVHIEMPDTGFLLREINLYVSKTYLLLVMPEHDSPRLAEMERRLAVYANALQGRGEQIASVYFWILQSLVSDFSDTLEALEDRMEALSGEIVANVSQGHFARINQMRQMAYSAQKHLRAQTYIGDGILLNENGHLDKKHLRYFGNVNTRFKKLYDFAESLYALSGEMLNIYDSRLSGKTADTVNKLTVVTLFFGPLSVITGVYGMNFKYMPGLGQRLGFFISLGVMAAVSLILFIIMKIKKWL